MADAIINFTTTDDVVPRNTNFVCNFSITKPNPTNSSTKTYVMTNNGTLDTGTSYSYLFNKTNWNSITNVLGQDDVDGVNQDIVTTGIYKIKYKYKIELVEAGITLKDYGTSYLDVDTNDSITLTASEFSTWNPYTIKITVEQDDGTIVTQTKSVHVYDTQPILQTFDVVNNIISITLQDNESDGIKFRISLNGSQVYPTGTGYTTIQPSPINYSMSLPRQSVVPNGTNTVVIDGTDSYGMPFTSTNTFIGSYIGLLFSDEGGNYYTTDLGVLIKYLDFGAIKAGTTSASQKVIIKNLTGTNITNLILTLDTTNDPVGTQVLFSTDDINYNTNSLEWTDLITNGNSKEFYVKIQIDALAYGTGIFKITSNATPV